MSSSSDYDVRLQAMAMRLTQTTAKDTNLESTDSSSDPFETIRRNATWSKLVQSSQGRGMLTQEQVTQAMGILGNRPVDSPPLSDPPPDEQSASSTPSDPGHETTGVESSPYLPPGEGDDNNGDPPPDSPVPDSSHSEGGLVGGADIDPFSESHRRNCSRVSQLYYFQDLVLCHPFKWGAALVELDTLHPGRWLAGSVIGLYLSHHWLTVYATSHMYYMDMEYTTNPNLPTEEEVVDYHRRNPLTPEHGDAFDHRPVVFVVHSHQHYFVVVFDYQNSRTFMFGSSISVSGIVVGAEHWLDWNGPLLWTAVAQYYGWPVPDVDGVHVMALRWLQVSELSLLHLPYSLSTSVQNGLDCGVVVVAVVMELLKDGLQFDTSGRILKPPIPCAHYTRNVILTFISANALQLYRTWQRITRRAGDQWGNARVEDAEDILNQEGSIHISAAPISASLARAMAKCRLCLKSQRDAAERQAEEQHGSSQSDHRVRSGGQSDQSDSHSQVPEDAAPLPDHLKKVKMMKGARNRNALNPRCPPANSKTIQLPPQRFIPLPSNRDFDEYYQGPTIEDNYDGPRYLYNFPTNPYAMHTEPGPWSTFKDYGYRLEPSFALMFNNEQPIMVREHLLPIGERPAMVDQLAHLEKITGDYNLSRNGKEGQTIQVNDIVSMGMEEMLQDTGGPNTVESMKAFVCGRDSTNDYIHFDPNRDEVEVDEDDIVTTVDIDSMIWVTHEPVFRNAVNVFVLPRIAKKAPIWRHNHVYVEILMPRSDEDKESPGRDEWLSKSFPLTAIPHTHFATIGMGAGGIDVSVFFPRMIHRDSMTGWRVNNIPMVVQNTWLSEIVLPSIIAASTEGCIEYVDFTLEEWRWKASINERFQKNKATPVHGSNMQGLLYSMRAIVRDNDELDMFGSFFFVCDFRGAKGITIGVDPYESLRREYPGIDWEYALQRQNGQLFLDVGISFHAITADNMKLVGLWRLDAVNASYQAAGMNKGVTHHSNTMAAVGGRQSEAELFRMRSVQLNFRSTYNLVFESIRKPGADSYFCNDDEAYDCSPAFLECCDRYMKIFQGAKGKSYGVREELRGSGPAMLTVLENAREKVQTRVISLVRLS